MACTGTVGPHSHRRRAPVITWYLDHVRFPECVAARVVFLYENPQEWTALMARQWRDLILPQAPVFFHVVTPDPDVMEAPFLAHVLVVQQPMEQFVSALITVFDSAMPGHLRRHATMIPSPLHYDTLLGVAYLDRDCTHHRNICEAWEADRPFAPDTTVHSHDGQPFTVAIHRHLLPAEDPDEPDPWEHQAPTKSNHPVHLSLDACIPAQPAPELTLLEQDQPQLLWFEDEAWLLRLEEQPSCKLLPLPDGLRVPDVSYWPLVDPPPADRQTLESYTLYLDGSSTGTHAGWSVVVTSFQSNREAFIGCAYGTVQLDRTQSDWFGAYTPDNVASELTAMVCAQNIALWWPLPQKVCIRPDLQLSRTVAESLTTCRSNQCLAQVCRAQGLWLAKKATVEEVRGHTGNPWNELADALAKHAMLHGLDPMKHEFSALQHFATCNHDVNWSWMQTTHTAMTACFPPLVNQQVMSFPDPDRTIPTEPVELQSPPDNASAVRWKLHLKSANVLASEVWDIRSNGSKRSGQRTLRLDQQWHDAGTHVVGVQEARTQSGKTNTPHYMVLASGAKEARAPLYGCELWLHRTMPICHLPDGTPMTFDQAAVVVQHADPRRLFVEVSIHHTVYSFVVLHAPCLGTQTANEISPQAIINQWWEETSMLCHKHIRSPLSWVMVDANAPLEQADNVHVGPHGAESAARHTGDFAAFLPAHGLIAPSTFAHFHHGQTTTWTHANGKT